MKQERRILALCSTVEHLEELIDKAAELSRELSAGVTLLYVKEERLFELPLFEKSDGSLEEIAHLLRQELRRRDCSDWAVLAYDNDLVDHARLEAERERSFLVLSDEHEELEKLVSALRRPLLVLRTGHSHRYGKVLVALDSAWSSEEGLDCVGTVAPGAKWSCYMDYQMIVTMADPTIDPVVGAMTPEILAEEENEVLQARRQAFEELCSRRGIEGSFEVGEGGLVEDILAVSSSRNPDLLAVVVEDPDTLMAEAARHLARRCERDLLVCYNH